MACARAAVVSIDTTISSSRLPRPIAATGHVLNLITSSISGKRTPVARGTTIRSTGDVGGGPAQTDFVGNAAGCAVAIVYNSRPDRLGVAAKRLRGIDDCRLPGRQVRREQTHGHQDRRDRAVRCRV